MSDGILLGTALRQALRSGHREARKQLLTLNQLNADRMFFPIDGSRHVGDPQHVADAAVLDAVENSLREQLPLVRVVGEESMRSIRAREYPVAVVDPIDGTKPFTHLGECWAVVLNLIESHDSTGELWVPVAGIATSAGLLVAISEERTVTVELLDDETTALTIIDCAPKGDRPLSLACVAAKAADASRYFALRSAFSDATVFTTGGNPVVLGVLTGDLDAIVSFDSQCSWDATYALAVALAGGAVGATTHHQIFRAEDILAWFRRPLQGTEEEIKIVPPIIAAKDSSVYAEVVARIGAEGNGSLPRRQGGSG
jgi:fructose-1,6-bisphosphatase/inositol monophosphatase family enzyme